MKNQLTFFIAGLLAGFLCVSPGQRFASILTLTWGLGPAFFLAVVAGIFITGARHYLQTGALQYISGLVICVVTYLLALVVFWWLWGLSPDWLGVRPSSDITEFGVDVAFGLIAAGIFGATGIALLAYVLTGRWSNSLMLRLLLAGAITIAVAFILNSPFHNYWSFFGVLLPLGNALFCYLVGIHIWQSLGQASRMAATA